MQLFQSAARNKLNDSVNQDHRNAHCSDMSSLLQILARRCIATVLLFALISTVSWRLLAEQSRSNQQITVILWFDTEDYLLPADDDASKRLAEMLSERGIRATFKVVGEKARVLEKRGRADVIAALKKHDIGYHANFHSVHPTPTEYLADCGLLDGIAEFARREGGGAADVRRIFGRETLACYGQPGSSWAAQAIAALPQIGVAPQGVPVYVDEGTHVGLGGKPFWYAGALNVYHMSPNYARMELHDPGAVEPAKRQFTAIAERLRTEDGGGLISIFYHPCEWVHREFWDGVNFRRGANPPREQWKPPPQRPPEETEAAFKRFAQYIDHIKSTPGVRFVTASDLPSLYPDRVRTAGASEEDLQQIVTRLTQTNNPGVDFLVLAGKAYSLAEQFELLSLALSQLIKEGKIHYPLHVAGALGPDTSSPPAREQFQILCAQVVTAAELPAHDPHRPSPVVPAQRDARAGRRAMTAPLCGVMANAILYPLPCSAAGPPPSLPPGSTGLTPSSAPCQAGDQTGGVTRPAALRQARARPAPSTRRRGRSSWSDRAPGRQARAAQPDCRRSRATIAPRRR
jgi:hypothetical protein